MDTSDDLSQTEILAGQSVDQMEEINRKISLWTDDMIQKAWAE